MSRHSIIAASVLVALVLAATTGCVRQEVSFTRGRIETTCGEAIPVCDSRAACVLDNGVYVEQTFPGGLKSIVRTESEKSRLIVRFLLREMIAPGTELLVRAWEPGCGNSRERHPTDVDLFDRAGDDRILEYKLPLPGRGDHMLEIFSDMSADYTMTTTVEKVE